MRVGYCLNLLDKPLFMVGTKYLLTEFSIHDRLESRALFVTRKLTKIYTLHILVLVSIFPNLFVVAGKKG